MNAHLDPDKVWIVIRDAAKLALAVGREFVSPNRDRRYPLVSVSDDEIVVERTGRDGKQQLKKLTPKNVRSVIECLNSHGGRHPRQKLPGDYYIHDILAELHPALRHMGTMMVIDSNRI